jgi:predicted RNA-binding protein YlxR (DUF448 family)
MAKPKASEAGAGEADESETGPFRRCIVDGAVKPVEEMIRFVIGPDGMVVPDILGRLPGRGMWLSASRDVVNTAAAKKVFAKVARRSVTVPPDLAGRVEHLLVARCLDLIGLARRAGEAVTGAEKVRAGASRAAVLLMAADGSPDERGKTSRLCPDVPMVCLLSAAEQGRAFGRDHAVHALLERGGLATRLLVEAGRLAGFRNGPDGQKPNEHGPGGD